MLDGKYPSHISLNLQSFREKERERERESRGLLRFPLIRKGVLFIKVMEHVWTIAIENNDNRERCTCAYTLSLCSMMSPVQ